MEIERGIDPSDRSDTPETDAAVFDIPNYGADGTGSRVAVVHYQVAVRLERERDAVRARVAELEAELSKLNDPVAVHINMLRGTIATPSVELMEHVWVRGEQTQQPLDRPDRPGWWWVWWPKEKEWKPVDVSIPDHWWAGQWLPATPPPVPVMSEKEDAR